MRIQSEAADNILWALYTESSHSHPALSRVSFEVIRTASPLRTLINYVSNIAASLQFRQRDFRNHLDTPKARFLIICGRSRRLTVQDHRAELKIIMEEHGTTDAGEEVTKTAGEVAASVILSRCSADVAVIQAAYVN